MTVNQCLCGQFEFGSYDETGDAESYESYSTECGATTTRVFAQGHDAKLVGYMVRAELAGHEISRTQGGVKYTYPGAVAAANNISQELGDKANGQLLAAKARLARKATQKPRGRAKVEAPVEAPSAPRPTRGKVGRWVYEGTELNGRFTYTKKFGGEVTVEAGNWTEVN
jgi:hypothetical protein